MESYERVPYRGGTIQDTHPNQLAAIAWLHGLRAPSPKGGRVLELGCGRGSNLLSMAWSLPSARFVGIDTAATQIDEARERAARLGLDNVDFRVADIVDFEDGPFDYVLAHGVLSWVRREVQDALLQLCGRSLTDEGIAYISYNTLPGWRFRGGIRDLLRFHAEQREDPEEQVREARSVLELLAELSGDDGYGRLVRREAKATRRFPSWYLFHDHLAEQNEPFYFRDFVRRAGQVGLAYLADAEPAFMRAGPEALERLRSLSDDPIRVMQYEDHLLHRAFRSSLLVRAGRAPSLEPLHDRVRDLRVAGLTRPEDGSAPDLSSSELVAYTTPEKKRFRADAPVVKAALQVLFDAWPVSMPFDSLYQEARGLLGRMDSGNDEERDLLTRSLLEGFHSAIFRLTPLPERVAFRVGERPVAVPLARLQVAAGEPYVTNGMHALVELRPFTRALLAHLDGRDRAGVVEALVDDLRSGVLRIQSPDGEPIASPDLARKVLGSALDTQLERLARLALMTF